MKRLFNETEAINRDGAVLSHLIEDALQAYLDRNPDVNLRDAGSVAVSAISVVIAEHIMLRSIATHKEAEQKTPSHAQLM